MVARRGDGSRAPIACREHRAADEAVDLHIPRYDPNKVKLILAAEIDPSRCRRSWTLPSVCDLRRSGQGVLSGQERKIYSANTDLPIRYELAVAVDPALPIAACCRGHGGGRAAALSGSARLGMTNHELALGDLILSSVREGRGNDLRAPVVLRVADGQLATYTEMYTNKPGALDDTKVVFEIADTADGPALQTSAADIRERQDQTMRQALAVVAVGALPPGRYIARAIFSRGDKSVGKLTRPFDVTADSGCNGCNGCDRCDRCVGLAHRSGSSREGGCGTGGDDGRRGRCATDGVQERRRADSRDAPGSLRCD